MLSPSCRQSRLNWHCLVVVEQPDFVDFVVAVVDSVVAAAAAATARFVVDYAAAAADFGVVAAADFGVVAAADS